MKEYHWEVEAETSKSVRSGGDLKFENFFGSEVVGYILSLTAEVTVAQYNRIFLTNTKTVEGGRGFDSRLGIDSFWWITFDPVDEKRWNNDIIVENKKMKNLITISK